MAAETNLRGLEKERAGRRGGGEDTGGSPGTASDWKPGDRGIMMAYLLNVFGGYLGLHHFYLGRPLHAGLWLCSPGLGGFFGLGAFLDLFKLPGYAAVRNAEPSARDQLDLDQKYYKAAPPWRFSRIIGCWLFGAWFGVIGGNLGPTEFPAEYFAVTKALAGGLGIWLAGSACTHQGGSLKATLAGALGGLAIGYQVCAALLAFQWTRRWEPESTKQRPSTFKVIIAVVFFWSAALNGVIQHGSITVDTAGGPKTFEFKESLYNVLRGIEFEDIKKGFTGGFDEDDSDSEKSSGENWWDKFRKSLDVSGEKLALKTLGMSDYSRHGYTEGDIKRHYRKLAMLHHPDRAPQGNEKREAEIKMQEINDAKEVLDGIIGASKASR